MALVHLAAEAAAAGDDFGLEADVLTAGSGDVEVSAAWSGLLLGGLPDTALVEEIEPPSFTGELRPYQRRGLSWLRFLDRLGLGGCLADDMGLGKTATTLAHLVDRGGPHLVVCPLSVVHNWETEARRFTPTLDVVVHHGAQRHAANGDGPDSSESAAALSGADLVVTTYGLVTRDLDVLAAVDWSTVVLDEAQFVKNPATRAARAVRRLRARQRIALTGTPVENRLAELWAILDWVNPGMLGSRERFRHRYSKPIERGDDGEVAAAAAAALKALTRPFVLRRSKSDRQLVPELPDKVEQVAWAGLTAEQAVLYQKVVDELLDAANEHEGIRRRAIVLAALTKLKQICNHPAHALGDNSRLHGRSGKLTRFDELVSDLVDVGERALVFTQFVEMGTLLRRHVAERFGWAVPFLHGSMSKAGRDRVVADFQAGAGPPLLLVSLKAGGTGLNLTAASQVIHYDRWWNPAVENQATDRAWRIGQGRTVFVHKLVCEGTVEERIAKLIDDKQALADLVVGHGEDWLGQLSTSELRELVRLDSSAVAEVGTRMTRPRPRSVTAPGHLVATMLRALAAELSDPGRYTRAKAYARDGAVIDIDVRPGVVSGLVLGSRREPYEVVLGSDPVPPDELAGADPAVVGAMAMLIPAREELAVSCTCPDASGAAGMLCKHAIAVLLVLADETSAAPELLPRWRSADESANRRAMHGTYRLTPRGRATRAVTRVDVLAGVLDAPVPMPSIPVIEPHPPTNGADDDERSARSAAPPPVHRRRVGAAHVLALIAPPTGASARRGERADSAVSVERDRRSAGGPTQPVEELLERLDATVTRRPVEFGAGPGRVHQRERHEQLEEARFCRYGVGTECRGHRHSEQSRWQRHDAGIEEAGEHGGVDHRIGGDVERPAHGHARRRRRRRTRHRPCARSGSAGPRGVATAGGAWSPRDGRVRDGRRRCATARARRPSGRRRRCGCGRPACARRARARRRRASVPGTTSGCRRQRAATLSSAIARRLDHRCRAMGSPESPANARPSTGA